MRERASSSQLRRRDGNRWPADEGAPARRRRDALKVLHFACLGLWVGGVASWIPLAIGLDPTDPESALTTYMGMRTIAWNVIGWGGIGTVFSGVVLAVVSGWGLFRHRWVVAKLALAPALVLFGMFFLERRLIDNLSLLDAPAWDPALAHEFTGRHTAIELGLGLQLLGFLVVIVISVVKPRLRF